MVNSVVVLLRLKYMNSVVVLFLFLFLFLLSKVLRGRNSFTLPESSHLWTCLVILHSNQVNLVLLVVYMFGACNLLFVIC
jgi:hypothetical protein